MAVDYTHHDGGGPDGGGRDVARNGARGAGVPFVVRTAGSRGAARTLADHLAAASTPAPPSTRAPAALPSTWAPAAPSAAPAPAPVRGGSPRPGAGPVFVWRARGGSSPRTLADHLHPAAATGPPAPPAAAPASPAPRPASPAAAAPATVRPPAARVAVVGEARESERRTVLDADEPVVALRAADLPRTGRLTATLRWQRPRTPAGVQSSTDVHLGCLWQTVTDHSGVVQSTGSLLSAPGFGARQVLRLGPRSEEDGEPLTVDLTTVDSMRRLLLFATGHRSPPPWGALGVHLVLALPSGAQVLTWVDEPEQPSLSLAIASVHVVDGDLVVRREDEPVPGPARDVALAYGWDLDWSADGTAPRL